MITINNNSLIELTLEFSIYKQDNSQILKAYLPLVSSGFGAGSPTATKRMSGGGVQYLCLPPNPEWNRYDMSNDTLAFGWVSHKEILTYVV